MPESDAVLLAREVIAECDPDAALKRLLDESDDPAFLADVAAYAARIAHEVARVAAQMAAEAVARGVDAPIARVDAAASTGVLELVYRRMAAS
jgi:hypothetical protein